MGSKPKQTNVYESTEAGLSAVLDELTTNEPKADGAPPGGAIDAAVVSADTLPATAGGPGPVVLTVPGEDLATPAAPPIDPHAAAENAVELVLTAVGRACDGEWQPDDAAERAELVTALEHVLQRRAALLGICGKIPPELILAAVVHRYARTRLTRPSTAARLRTWAAGKGGIFRRLFGEKQDVKPLEVNEAGVHAAFSPGSNGNGRLNADDPYSGYE